MKIDASPYSALYATAAVNWQGDYSKGRLSFGLIYDGAYGTDKTSHTGRLMFTYDF